MERYKTLADYIWFKRALTEQQIEALVNLFGKRCQERTKNALRWRLGHITDTENYGIYTRVHIDGTDVSYCAGQDYVSEIRTVRECIIGK